MCLPRTTVGMIRWVAPCALFPLLGTPSNASSLQVALSVAQEPTCPGCQIEVTSKTSLGSEEGEGFVDWPSDVSRNGGKYLVVNRSSPYEVRVFSSTGEFLRTFGSAGQGPGEYQEIWDLFSSEGDTLFVIDIAARRVSRLSPELELINTTRLIGRPMKAGFVSLPDGGFVLNAPFPSSDGVVDFLHRVDSTGRRSLSLSTRGEANSETLGPEAFLRIPALSKGGDRVFVARREAMSVEEWSVDGTLLRTASMVDRGWETQRPGGSPGYSAGIQHLWADDAGYLWILVRIIDPDWEDAVEGSRAGLGAHSSMRITDHNGYWDSVIEVWDLSRMQMVTQRLFPEFFHGFLESGEVYSFRDAGLSAPLVEVFELRLRGGKAH